jgi:hypothetical protein
VRTEKRWPFQSLSTSATDARHIPTWRQQEDESAAECPHHDKEQKGSNHRDDDGTHAADAVRVKSKHAGTPHAYFMPLTVLHFLKKSALQ